MLRPFQRWSGAVGGAAALWLSVAAPLEAGNDRSKWWLHPGTRAELELSDDQSRALEAIFQSTLPRMRAEKATLDREDARLSRLMREGADEQELALAIERVEAARSAANKTRTWMLVRMYRVLTPAQRVKLQAMHERQQRERHEGNACGDPSRPSRGRSW